MTLQPSFSGPLYRQVHSLIRSRIEAGEWGSGGPMPGEADLSRQLGVSVGTVRKALDMLARDRVVVRARGRGTFVQEDGTWRPEPGLRLYDRRGKPLRAQFTVTEAATGIPTASEVKALGRSRNAEPAALVLRVQRDWSLADALLCRETITVDATRFADLPRHIEMAGETFADIYAEQFDCPVARFEWTMAPIVAEDPLLKAFEPSRRACALQVTRIALDADGRPFEHCAQMIGLSGESVRLVQ
jgi:GntR family transcriptional regulator